MTGDITRSTLEALAALRGQRLSAHKLGMTTGVHRRRAIKLLATAEELGLVERCGATRKGHPVYQLRQVQRCPVCASALPR
jgi:DNA-binding IclR family transcriptional regulator